MTSCDLGLLSFLFFLFLFFVTLLVLNRIVWLSQRPKIGSASEVHTHHPICEVSQHCFWNSSSVLWLNEEITLSYLKIVDRSTFTFCVVVEFIYLVSWHFEPSQPQRITSGLMVVEHCFKLVHASDLQRNNFLVMVALTCQSVFSVILITDAEV